ncbi:MAG: hypothetical protein NPIRA01_38410 [Nitrospirales bacterium]|nr:MAG: hypothetical protein NPIRA01_38410 [Nitrospirales bacterium]
MVLPAFVVAQVATTITLDSSLPFNTVVTQIGDVHSIEAGTVRGQNQFHSFSQFDLGTGQIASFNGPATIVNILSRVTGGVPSSIDGTLRSSIEGTNMFFLNPAGVIFGAEAKLDLTGSFHVSTADFLRFEDDATFYADASLDRNPDSILTAAPLKGFGFLNNPTTFGFTNTSPESLVFEGADFQVSEGETISVVGGDIILKSRGIGNDSHSASLSAEGGLIHVVSIKSSSEVPVDMQEFEASTIEHYGEIILSDEAAITTNGVRGGAVVIRSGRLVMDDSEISVNTRNGNGNPIGIDIHTKKDIVLTHNSRITSNTHGSGQAGNIHEYFVPNPES